MRPRRRTAVVAAALAAALAVVAVPAPEPARAQTTPPVSSEGLRLAAQTPWVAPEGEFSLSLVIDDDLHGPDRELAVTVYQRLTSRSAFALSLDDVFVGSPLEVTDAPLSELTPNAAGSFVVRLPVRSGAASPAPDAPDRLLLRREGVYPVRIEIREAGGGRVHARLTTHLVRLPAGDDLRPLAVAWVQPLQAAPAHQPDGSIALRQEDEVRLDRVLEGLGAARGTPITLAPQPETVEALAARADEGDALAASLLAGFVEAARGNQVLAGPYAPIPLATLMETGLEGEVTAHITRGEDALVAHMETRPDRRTWLVDGALGDDGVALLRQLGIQRLVMHEESLEPVNRSLTLTQPFLVQGGVGRTTEAVVVDAGLTSHFPTRSSDDPVLNAHHLLADLAVLYFDLPGVERGVVVAPPEEWAASARFVAAVLNALTAAPILEPVTVDGLLDRVPLAEGEDDDPLVRPLVELDPPPLRLPPSQVRATRERLAGYALLASSDSPVLDRAEIPLLLATAAGLSTSDRREQLAAANQAIDEEIAAIRAPDREGITLTAREGLIPLTFENRTGRPVDVRLDLQSDKLEFPQGSSRALRLDQRNTTVEVQVRARTSGAFPLRITVTSPDGRLLVSRTRVTVRSTAVSGVGLFLTVGAGVFLAGWWGRHLRDGRRARRLVTPP